MLVIFDNVLGLGLFEGKNLKAMKVLAASLQHSLCSVVYGNQAYKSIPRLIRVNCTNLLWNIKNEQERRKIHEEFPLIGDFKKWNTVFEQIVTKSDHAMAHLNFQNPPKYQLIQDFDSFVDIP